MASKGIVPTGRGEEIVLSESTFRSQQRTIQNGVLPGQKAGQKRKREGKGDSSTVFGANAYRGPWAKFKERTPEEEGSGSEVEVTDYSEEDEEDGAKPALPKLVSDYAPEGQTETSEFHGSEMYDYQGRTYMHVPQDLDVNLTGDLPDDFKCYVPKKNIFTWKQHAGHAITQMRFFPNSGHLLLTASASGKVKLFDVYHQRELLRTYSGHTRSCNDISFSNDGAEFITASYDRYMKIWDTETGVCKAKFTTGQTPHVVRYYPRDNSQFVAGMRDKKIVQYDIRSGEMVQEYDHHLDAINTITFCDEDRRFVTTSDDKSLRAWEYNIPVPIKFIAEPHMYPMTRATHHPTKEFIALQSSDNQIVVYSSSDRFRQNRKKGFRGHNNAGHAIDLSISPDGEYLMSGDTGGYVCWWSWKTCKMLHKVQASRSAVVSCVWHPRETSKVVTGDLDGVVKYWD